MRWTRAYQLTSDGVWTTKSCGTSAADFEVPPEFAAIPCRNFKIVSGTGIKSCCRPWLSEVRVGGAASAHERRKAGNRHLDAGVKLAEVFSTDDGGKKARSPRRVRSKPLKPLLREGRSLRRSCGDDTRMLTRFCIRGCGHVWRPAFPARSDPEEPRARCQTQRESAWAR
jgi:hypothetical protein